MGGKGAKLNYSNLLQILASCQLEKKKEFELKTISVE